MALLIGLDLGTTTIKAALLDTTQGRIVRVAARPTPTSHPRPEWSEHDPEAFWQAAAACLKEIAPALEGRPVAGLAISSLAEAGLPLDSSGQPLYPIIAWYDRRSEPQAAWVEQQIPVAALYEITGQRASTSFSITKILWLRQNAPEAYARMTHWLPVSSYILYRLCGAAATDYTIAARTLLFDQSSLAWSEPLLKTFDLDSKLLPQPYPGGTQAGRLTGPAAAQTGLPDGIPCCLGGHDHLCAALASGAVQPGAVADSTGSAEALIFLLSRFLPNPALAEGGFACYAYLLPGVFALKGGLKAAGNAIEWLARQISGPGAPDYPTLEAEARAGVGIQAGPLWLPHLIGSGSPQADRAGRAALIGARFEHTRGDLFRAMLEGLACWTRHNLEVMSAFTGLPYQSFTLTGGTTRLHLLSQLKADLLNCPVTVPEIPEGAAAGAALLAGLGVGLFASPAEAASVLAYPRTRFEPDPARAAWYDCLYREVYQPLYASLRATNQALEDLSSLNR